MPATTRSNTQVTLEDRGVWSSKSASKSAPKAPKRKATESASAPSKKQKKQPTKPTATKTKQPSDGDDDVQNAETMTINRAPVLELWASCVTQFLHPALPWSTCLSVGGAISTITAISKGRAIGTYDKPDPGEQQRKSEKRKADQAKLDEVEVMSFHLKIKSGNAMVGDKPKKGNEEALRKKFGDEAYDKAKKTFEEVLKNWKGKEEELDKRAFGMYEDFRPDVPKGQKGWGRKGELNLKTVRSAADAG